MTRAAASPVASSFLSRVLTNIPCVGLPEFGNKVVAVTIEIGRGLVMRRPYEKAKSRRDFRYSKLLPFVELSTAYRQLMVNSNIVIPIG